MIWVVIMAGGQGTRFWPLSTPQKPKQLLPIVSRRTMLEDTARRMRSLASPKQTLIVTNAAQVKEVKRLLPSIPARNIIAEPCGRNTAPCIGLAAHMALKRDSEAVLIVVPADQMIKKERAFRAVLKRAAHLAAETPWLITLGIRPVFPATGYGYIEAGRRIRSSTFHVRRFVEKPPLGRARKMFRSARFSWNSGMFIWRADVVLNSIKQHLPAVSAGLKKIAPYVDGSRFSAALKRNFHNLPSISIDYGVLEKTSDALVIRCDIGWSDVGSWDTAGKFWPRDKHGNFVRGRWAAIDSENNIIFNDGKLPIACVGVKGLTVVASAQGTLICDQTRSQDIRKIPPLLAKK